MNVCVVTEPHTQERAKKYKEVIPPEPECVKGAVAGGLANSHAPQAVSSCRYRCPKVATRAKTRDACSTKALFRRAVWSGGMSDIGRGGRNHGGCCMAPAGQFRRAIDDGEVVGVKDSPRCRRRLRRRPLLGLFL